MHSALKPWCTAITNLLQFWELCVCILFTCNDFILNCFFLSSWQPFILFQLQLINPWPLGRLFWYLTLTWVKSAVLPTHSISAILYACQFLLYLQSFMPVTVTVQPPWGIPLHHFYDNVNGVVLMINTQAFIKHFMSTEDPHSSEGVPALKSASLNCNPLLCCGSCSCFPNYLLIHFLPWSSKTVLLSFNCSVKVVVRIKENMCEGFKIVLTKINSNHVGSNYSSCRSRGNPWHVFSLCSYYKSVFQDIISEANRTKLHKMGKIIIAILLS